MEYLAHSSAVYPPKTIMKHLAGHYRKTAEKLVSVEKIPRYGELSNLNDHMEKDLWYGAWRDFCSEENIFHAFCYEFVGNLIREIKKLGIRDKVVEVCAGNGKLSYWLWCFGVPLVATDDYSWEDEIFMRPGYVERLSHQEALRKYNPELVIGCWIPLHSTIAMDVLDWKSVKYYIDIGEECTGVEELWNRNDVEHSSIRSANNFKMSRTEYSSAHLFRKK